MTQEQFIVESIDIVSRLEMENASLREQLEKAMSEASELQRKALALSEAEDPFVMPTDEELFEMIHGPRGRSPFEVLEEFERMYGRERSSSTSHRLLASTCGRQVTKIRTSLLH